MMEMLVINKIALKLGPFAIHWYAILIVTGSVIGVWLACRESVRRHLTSNDVTDFVLWAVPFGLLGVRIYYVIFQWSYYSQHPSEIIALWDGGGAIYGGLVAGVIVLFIFAHIQKFNPLDLLDIAVPAVLIGQAFGRWGNFVNQEAYGNIVSNLNWLPSIIRQQMFIDGAYRQPTGLARCRIRTGAWIEPQIPFLGSHQPVDDGLQGASGDGEAQQGHENPAQSVVLAQLLNPLNAIQTESGWNRQQPAQPVAEAVQVEAVQPQRPSQKGEPSRQCLVFHAVIIAAKSCHPGPETAPSAPRQASGRISSRRRRARPHAENPERDARRSSRCCPSRR